MFRVLVFVAACGHHDPTTAASGTGTVVADAAVARRPEAESAPAIDAAAPDAAIYTVDADAGDPRPRAIPTSAYRIVEVMVERGGSILKIAGGRDRGIQKDWNASLFDPTTGHGPTATILRVDERTTTLRTTVSSQEIRRRFTHARIVP